MNILSEEEVEIDGVVYPCRSECYGGYQFLTVYSRPKHGMGIGGLVWFVIVKSCETNNTITRYGNFTYKTRENLVTIMDLLDETR